MGLDAFYAGQASKAPTIKVESKGRSASSAATNSSPVSDVPSIQALSAMLD
jgi:hypothetical protein